jgi:tetratricopeptide (TPR) repeat protein
MSHLRRQQDLQTTIQELQKCVSMVPANVEAKVALADIYMLAYFSAADKPEFLRDEVARLSRALIEQQQDTFDGLRLRGFLALTDGRLSDASRDFSRALEIKPLHPDAALGMVQTLFLEGKHVEAEGLAWRLIASRPGFLPVYDTLHEQYVARNLYDKAEKVLRDKIRADSASSPARIQLAAFLYRRKKDREMHETLNGLIGDPATFPLGRMQAADLYRNIGLTSEARRLCTEGVRVDPANNDEYQKRLAALLMLEGRRAEAKQIYENVLSGHPGDDNARAALAALLMDQDAGAAVKQLVELNQQMPDNPVLLFQLGLAQLAAGDVQAARISCLQALRRKRDFLPARLTLAELALSAGDFQTAYDQASQALRIAPQHPQGRLLRAAGSAGLNQLAVAEFEINTLIKEFPQYTDAHLQRGYLYLRQKQPLQAELTFRRVYQPGQKDLRPLAGLVESFLARGQAQSAVELIMAQLSRSNAVSQVRFLLASTYLRAGQYEDAIREYRQLLESAPESASIHLRLGEGYYRKGSLMEALTALTRARDLDPRSPEISIFLAVALDGAGRKQEAISEYRMLAPKLPSNVLVLNNLAWLLVTTGGDLNEALTWAGKARAAAPENANVADTIGTIYLRSKQIDAALQVFRGIVDKNPQQALFQLHLGEAWLAKGDRTRARHHFELALRNKPSSEEEAQIRALLTLI